MANSNLRAHLYKPNNLLSWKSRLKICISSARELLYLRKRSSAQLFTATKVKEERHVELECENGFEDQLVNRIQIVERHRIHRKDKLSVARSLAYSSRMDPEFYHGVS
ncbi:hypothetical protein LguiA_017303 [Lonicera macranthoides]